MIDSWAVLSAAVAGLGADDVGAVQPRTFSSPDGSARVGVFALGDLPQPGVTSWGSVGMCFFDNDVRTGDDRSLRVELVAAVDSLWVGAGGAVARCALAVAEGQSCTPGSVFRDAFAIDATVTTPHAVFVAPFLWSRFQPIEEEIAVVTWLQVLAVTPTEADYAVEHGVAALTRLFEAAQPDLFDLARVSVVPS